MRRIKHRPKPKHSRISQPIQLGFLNQAGQGNTQTVHLKLVQQLRLCQSSCDSLMRELALSRALVAAKDETIALLRVGYNQPN
ncbi:hypothetical protein KB206_01565 [Microvirga sp. STS02]|uniref:hypothetical protein n=1 Tax=Hymenobacter negativus TaxID=2795026 RepID=UPI0018DC5841|nr:MULTISPECIES: hypothetical protein [Bacteria]MBH8567554.1 hypothetical protein [Hymenobacter negativus]MBR7207286.1 hypothetical protein [Microvirga sp. STS02]